MGCTVLASSRLAGTEGALRREERVAHRDSSAGGDGDEHVGRGALSLQARHRHGRQGQEEAFIGGQWAGDGGRGEGGAHRARRMATAAAIGGRETKTGKVRQMRAYLSASRKARWAAPICRAVPSGASGARITKYSAS